MQILNWILPHKNLLLLPSGHKDITFMPNTGTSVRFSGSRSMKIQSLKPPLFGKYDYGNMHLRWNLTDAYR